MFSFPCSNRYVPTCAFPRDTGLDNPAISWIRGKKPAEDILAKVSSSAYLAPLASRSAGTRTPDCLIISPDIEVSRVKDYRIQDVRMGDNQVNGLPNPSATSYP